MPAAGWSAKTGHNGAVTYRYRDSTAVLGPCSQVEVGDRGIRAKCGRAALGFGLDEARQTALALSVTIGSTSGGTRLCGLFGGTVPTDVPGRFTAKKAPRPDRCRLPESYY